MYQVSEAYKKAMKEPVHRFLIGGSISNTPFFDRNVLKGSFSITNQCSDDSEMKIGQVYVGELNATFVNLNVERYSLQNKLIKPTFSRKTADGYETIPLGVFKVSEASWTSSGIVIKAYDNMAELDKGCDVNSANGTPYELALLACKSCKLELGTTKEEFKKFANGIENLSMVAENDIETWRDFISWVAQTCACFVTADRFGKIVFRAYGDTVVDTIDSKHRFTGASFSDFETRYTGLSCVNIGDKTTSYYGMEVDDALTYNLGSNPFLQYGVDDAKEEMRRAILHSLQNICYVPFKASMIGDPVYDLGDVLSMSEGIADGSKLYCITKYTFNYNGEYEVQGVGKNPAIANAKSKTDKNIAGLMNQDDENLIHFTVFTNTGPVVIEDKSNQSVFSMRFIATKTTHVALDMEILLNVETTEEGEEYQWVEHDAVAKVHYYIDGAEIDLRKPVETWQDGQHILTLRYDLQAVDAAIHTWDVWIEMQGGSATIDTYGIHAVAMGQGLAAESDWDGTITASDEVDRYTFSLVRDFTDSANTTLNTPARAVPGDILARFDFTNMFGRITDSNQSYGNMTTFTPYVNASRVMTDADYNNTTGWQGAGEIKKGTNKVLTTTDVYGVTSVETASQNAVFYASFDSGSTWVGWTSEGWVENVTMIKKEIEAVPKSAWKQYDKVRFRVLLEGGATLYALHLYGGTLHD
jgi:hypothetical protein|nr:MAG TPA: hypothetical protein [Caudoviricetes sp.]